ncbi:hypothetical protein, partial [Pseudomonas sp.]|uniref:hypothetical protein n=1 Tax=Pseudomonas sp. TaxID=306 RepID=UPI0035680110
IIVGAALAANSSRHSQSFAAEAERRPAAPTGTHKPTDTIAPGLLRDSAASGRRAISYQTTNI